MYPALAKWKANNKGESKCLTMGSKIIGCKNNEYNKALYLPIAQSPKELKRS